MSDYRSSNYRGKKQQSGSTIFSQIGAALTGLWRLFTKGSSTKLDQDKLKAQFLAIEQLLVSNDAIHAAQAIVRADSFVSDLMEQVGGQGATFADRLRSLESRFSGDTYQALWTAHKLRNTIAHEQITISIGQARGALQTFRHAASQLGAF